MPLTDVSALLAEKRPFMFAFMDNYLFTQIGVPRKEVLSNLENFDRMIDFCLWTRQRVKLDELREAKALFSDNFGEVRARVAHGDAQGLRDLVYSAPGVGQKIGNLILEVIVHYGESNPYLESQLYVPIDTHVRRILVGPLGLGNVPQVACSPYAPRYVRFQEYLAANAAPAVPPICFDYLWFVGKVLCTDKDRPRRGYSRAYRLCSLCWIKDYCIVPDKWDMPSPHIAERGRPQCNLK